MQYVAASRSQETNLCRWAYIFKEVYDIIILKTIIYQLL